MGQVTLSIGGYNYNQSCRDGDEQHLHSLGEMVDKKVMLAVGSVGAASEVRQLILGSLLLADELKDAQRGVTPTAAPSAPAFDPAQLEAIASRLEQLAAKLENGAA